MQEIKIKSQDEEINVHNKLNKLQEKIEEYEIFDMDEYIYNNRIKSYCKECSRGKLESKELCKICSKEKFKTKLDYGIFTSGWIGASIVSVFFLSNYTTISFGLSCGTLLNLGFKFLNPDI
jgi:hypothetical protein